MTIEIRELNKSNSEEIVNLLNNCIDYFELVEGEKPNINTTKGILEDLPSEKTIDDKKVFGFYDNQELIALVDFIKGYKTLDEGIIGLFLVDERKRNLGIGKYVHQEIIKVAQSYSLKKLRIGVAESDKVACILWKELGYGEIERKNMTIGKKENTVIVMNYII